MSDQRNQADHRQSDSGQHGDATSVLQRLVSGDSAAAAELFPLVYQNLRSLAGNYFRSERKDQTLQPTALVHEAFLKLVGYQPQAWTDRAHFLAVAARAMRQILHDHARMRRSAKRGGGWHRVGLDEADDQNGPDETVGLVDLDAVLTRLANLDTRQATIVEMRFFGGLSNKEIAHVMDLNVRTIEKEWRRTRAWLSVALTHAGENGDRSG